MIINRLIVEKERWQATYAELHYRFRSFSSDEIIFKATELIKICSSSLEESFAYEFLLFSRMFTNIKFVAEIMKAQIEDILVTSFPNVNIAFQIYLSIFGTILFQNCNLSKIICSQLWDKNDCLFLHFFNCKLFNAGDVI